MAVIKAATVFDIQQHEDGRIKSITKNGKPVGGTVHFEMPPSMVKTYFTICNRELGNIKASDSSDTRREHGLQSFLMALVGLEAFLNVFFAMVGHDKGRIDVVDFASSNRSVEAKFSGLPTLAFGTHLRQQTALNKKVTALYRLRSDIVHTKWTPATAILGSELVFAGLAENFQEAFSDGEFCVNAFHWCLLMIARIGCLNGFPDDGSFCRVWTGIHVTDADLSKQLGLED